MSSSEGNARNASRARATGRYSLTTALLTIASLAVGGVVGSATATALSPSGKHRKVIARAAAGNFIQWNCVRGPSDPCGAGVAHTYDDNFMIMKRNSNPGSGTDTANSLCARLIPRDEGNLRQKCAGGLGQPANPYISNVNNTSTVRYANGIHGDGISHYIAGNAEY